MKLKNIYARAVPGYDDIPKAVLAAIAFSFALRLTGNENFDDAKRVLVTEWNILNSAGNGIVPQVVPASLRKYIMGDDEAQS